LSGVLSAFVVGAVHSRVSDAASTSTAGATAPARTSITMRHHERLLDAIRARVPDFVPLVMGRRLLVIQTLLGCISEGWSGKEGARVAVL